MALTGTARMICMFEIHQCCGRQMPTPGKKGMLLPGLQMSPARSSEPGCGIPGSKRHLPSCLRLVFKYRAPAQLRSAETSKIEGAELNAPCPEAPRSACYTSTPSRARLGAYSVDCVT